MDSDEDDFVFYGTPIEREEDITTSRKKKAVAEASGQLRTLVPWKQEVIPSIYFYTFCYLFIIHVSIILSIYKHTELKEVVYLY